jgi:hypothetical protein
VTGERDPITSLDVRFGGADTVATDWPTTRRALESAEAFWMTTVRRDGRPHVTLLVAVWLDNAAILNCRRWSRRL